MAQHHPVRLDRDLSGSHQFSALVRRSSHHQVCKRPIPVHVGNGYLLVDRLGVIYFW